MELVNCEKIIVVAELYFYDNIVLTQPKSDKPLGKPILFVGSLPGCHNSHQIFADCLLDEGDCLTCEVMTTTKPFRHLGGSAAGHLRQLALADVLPLHHAVEAFGDTISQIAQCSLLWRDALHYLADNIAVIGYHTLNEASCMPVITFLSMLTNLRSMWHCLCTSPETSRIRSRRHG